MQVSQQPSVCGVWCINDRAGVQSLPESVDDCIVHACVDTKATGRVWIEWAIDRLGREIFSDRV